MKPPGSAWRRSTARRAISWTTIARESGSASSLSPRFVLPLNDWRLAEVLVRQGGDGHPRALNGASRCSRRRELRGHLARWSGGEVAQQLVVGGEEFLVAQIPRGLVVIVTDLLNSGAEFRPLDLERIERCALFLDTGRGVHVTRLTGPGLAQT